MAENKEDSTLPDVTAQRTRSFPISMVLGAFAAATFTTALWILATWLVGLPLVVLPLGMGLAVGAVTGFLSPRPDRPQAVFAVVLALAHGVVGNVASTLLLATPPETLSTFRHTWTYLRHPGRLRNVLARTFTPMDVLIYGFVAGAAYFMVQHMARRKTPKVLPVGGPLPPRNEKEDAASTPASSSDSQ